MAASRLDRMDLMDAGFAVLPAMIDEERLHRAELLLASIDRERPEVMAGDALFAVRNVVGLVPSLLDVLWNGALDELVRNHVAGAPFLTRSIFFDKPAASNWWVAHHQDLSISVATKANVSGYAGWTAKHGMIGVVPPAHILEQTLTVRIHFDDTDATNGALRVIPNSHVDGIRPFDPMMNATDVVCPVHRGGVMLMRPLLFHASRRSTSERSRRVLHLEFNHAELAAPLQWAERRSLPDRKL